MPDAKATAIFDADDSKLQETVKRIDERLEKTGELFRGLAELWVFEKAAEGTAKLAEGVKEVLEMGSHFHELSEDTGAPVAALMALDQQFHAMGKDASDIVPTLSHLQKVLGEGTQTTLIGELGVDIEELRKKNPVEQMQMLGRAIAALENPTDRSTAAMLLFGREGASLISLFKDASGFQAAADAVGSQAQILEQDAALFSDASTKLGESGLKARGFFVGVADEIVPTLMPLLERFEKFDAAQAGQTVGQTINAFAASQDLAGLIINALLVSGSNFIEFVTDGLATAFHSTGVMLLGVAEAFTAEIEAGLGKATSKLGGILPVGGGFLSAAGAALASDAGKLSAQSRGNANAMASWVHTGIMDGVTGTLDRELGNKIDAALGNASDAHAAAIAAHPQLTEAIGEQALELSVPNVSHLASIGGAFGQVGGGDPLIEANNIARQQLDALHDIRDRLPAAAVPNQAVRKPTSFPE